MDSMVSAITVSETANGPVSSAKQEIPKPKNQAKNDKANLQQAQLQAQKSDTTSTSSGKLDGAALKAQKKAEKAAKRAQVVAGRDKPATPTLVVPTETSQGGRRPSTTGGRDVATKALHKQRTGSNAGDSRPIGLKGRQGENFAESTKEDKTVEAFRHLYPRTRTTALAGATKDIHPAVLSLGLQMSNWVICGSNARLVATLQVFKQVIASYTTPSGNTLSRHFTPHILSPQIGYLASCRPLSISMGVAIRWLKMQISKVDPDTPDARAKEDLIVAISDYIRDRVTLADKVISERACEKCIKNGDVILTYAKSSVVQKSLVDAHQAGTRFKVICIDSRLSEGRAMAHALKATGIQVQYCFMNSLPHVIKSATKVILGAHAMLGDGKLLSRAGTAQVTMLAKDFDKPVIVLCESVKCSANIAIDSTSKNEVASPDELFSLGHQLSGWRDIKGVQALNLCYDVTPREYLSMIVTELGCVSPTSIAALHRLSNNDGQGF